MREPLMSLQYLREPENVCSLQRSYRKHRSGMSISRTLAALWEDLAYSGTEI